MTARPLGGILVLALLALSSPPSIALLDAAQRPTVAPPPAPPVPLEPPQSAPLLPRAQAVPRVQTPPQPPEPPRPVVVAPKKQGQPVNIRTEFTITDLRGSEPPVKRFVSVLVADGDSGSIRSQAEVFQVGNVPLNIDVNPEILQGSKIRLGFTLQYDWPAPVRGADNQPPPRGTVMKTNLFDRISLIVDDGKSIVAAESADPIGDRKVSVEVKATILR